MTTILISSLALAAAAFVRMRQNDEVIENDENDDVVVDDIDNQQSSTASKKFPWEPENRENDVILIKRQQLHDPGKELNFLASMTFANGGLREPTCPCCI